MPSGVATEIRPPRHAVLGHRPRDVSAGHQLAPDPKVRALISGPHERFSTAWGCREPGPNRSIRPGGQSSGDRFLFARHDVFFESVLPSAGSPHSARDSVLVLGRSSLRPKDESVERQRDGPVEPG